MEHRGHEGLLRVSSPVCQLQSETLPDGALYKYVHEVCLRGVMERGHEKLRDSSGRGRAEP